MDVKYFTHGEEEPEVATGTIKKECVTYAQMERYVDGLCAKLQADGKAVNGVYGPVRGGVMLASMISSKLGVPLLSKATDGCCIVDDISDTGDTLSALRSKFPNSFITTMFQHPRSCVTPDYAMFTKGENWLLFPYEQNKEDIDKSRADGVDLYSGCKKTNNGVSWRDIDEFAYALSDELERQNFKPDGVYATEIGGLQLAVRLSYLYKDKLRGCDLPLVSAMGENTGKYVVVCDDSTGSNFAHYRKGTNQINNKSDMFLASYVENSEYQMVVPDFAMVDSPIALKMPWDLSHERIHIQNNNTRYYPTPTKLENFSYESDPMRELDRAMIHLSRYGLCFDDIEHIKMMVEARLADYKQPPDKINK